MELCDYYLKYMNALCEGTLAAPEGIALSGETPEERAMSLQAALKNVSVPDFVRRCARAAAFVDGCRDPGRRIRAAARASGAGRLPTRGLGARGSGRRALGRRAGARPPA